MQLADMNVLVTGGTGYIGSVLLRVLAARREIERITAVSLSSPRGTLPDKVSFHKLDIRDPRFTDLVKGHQVVVHTAAVVLWPRRMSAKERDSINIDGTVSVARAAVAAGVRKFVHASSMGAYDPRKIRGQSLVAETFTLGDGRSGLYYWDAKASQERLLQEILSDSRTVLTLLRPTYIMGPSNKSAARAYRRNAVNFVGANPRRQFVDERDVADAFALAVLEDLPGAYNVVPDDFLYLREAWRLAGASFVPVLPLLLAKVITWLRWRYGGSPVHPMWVEDLLLDFTGSNARLKAAGWCPRWTSYDAFTAAVQALEKSKSGNLLQ